MVYYIVHGWILPSEKAEENLTQNLINMALLTLMKREYEHENEEKTKPSQEKMEDFLMEILELTEEGQMLLRARNQSLEPILYEYLIQDEMDVLTLSQVLMNLPTP